MLWVAKKADKPFLVKSDCCTTILIAFVFILDRLSKNFLSDSCFWRFCVSRAVNDGAAFGILSGQTLFLIVVGVGVLMLVAMSYRESNRIGRIGLALIAAGTISNMFDRIFYRYVLDVFTIFGSSSFNLADMSNLFGAILFITSLFSSVLPRKR